MALFLIGICGLLLCTGYAAAVIYTEDHWYPFPAYLFATIFTVFAVVGIFSI